MYLRRLDYVPRSVPPNGGTLMTHTPSRSASHSLCPFTVTWQPKVSSGLLGRRAATQTGASLKRRLVGSVRGDVRCLTYPSHLQTAQPTVTAQKVSRVMEDSCPVEEVGFRMEYFLFAQSRALLGNLLYKFRQNILQRLICKVRIRYKQSLLSVTQYLILHSDRGISSSAAKLGVTK